MSHCELPDRSRLFVPYVAYTSPTCRLVVPIQISFRQLLRIMASGFYEHIMAANSGKDMTKVRRLSQRYRYDVALSFAGEDRHYVERVAKELQRRGIRVFYDKYEQTELWGKGSVCTFKRCLQ